MTSKPGSGPSASEQPLSPEQSSDGGSPPPSGDGSGKPHMQVVIVRNWPFMILWIVQVVVAVVVTFLLVSRSDAPIWACLLSAFLVGLAANLTGAQVRHWLFVREVRRFHRIHSKNHPGV